MSIVTFYSYKGGVGRSLALANVAVQLAQLGKKVLVIDWDLEAPGLEEYFDEFRADADGRGLLFLLKERGNLPDYIWRLTSLRESVSLDLLPSGRDEADYYPTLEQFNMDDFFSTGGGDYLEALRVEWQQTYDHVLIDSRTGLSDAGGICTIQLPDIVVGLFTATRQSVRGVRDVLQLAQRSRQNLAYTRPQFSVIPVPSRLNGSKPGELDKWMDEFSDSMERLTQDWRPKDLSARQVMLALSVGHDDNLVHGTRIIEHDLRDKRSQPYAVYKKVVNLIDTDLSDLAPLKVVDPKDLVNPSVASMFEQPDPSREKTEEKSSSRMKPKYKYHVMYSMPGGSIESRWVEAYFDRPFRKFFETELGEDIDIFWDRYELSSGPSMNELLVKGIESSATMIAFLSHRSLRTEWANREMQMFVSERAILGKSDSFFPILLGLSSDELPRPFDQVQSIDLSEYFFAGGKSNSFQGSEHDSRLNDQIRKLASRVADVIRKTRLSPFQSERFFHMLPVKQATLVKKYLEQIKNDGGLYKKVESVLARKAKLGETIVSVTSDGEEGHNVANEGDVVVQNQTDAKEEYIVKGETFINRYNVEFDLTDKWQVYEPSGEARAIPITHAVTAELGVGNNFFIEAAWGDSQFACEGDYFVTPSPNFDEIYRVGKPEFEKTYVLKE